MDPKGAIIDIHIISHSETPSYVLELDAFLDQFPSKSIKDAYILGKDIDGISRATITSEAIARAVERSLKKVAADVLGLEVAGALAETKPLPVGEIVIPLVLFGIAVAGVLTYNSVVRWAALLGGLLYFGLVKSTMVSTVHVANLFLLKFPSFAQSPLWYMMVGLTLLTTILWGMVYCGSLCPFASVQELLYNMFSRKKDRSPGLSYAMDRRARYMKYAVLVVAIAISIILGNASAASIEPFLTLFTQNAGAIGWVLLIFMLAAAMFHFRFWCEYLCPVGAVLGLVAHKSFFKIKLSKECTHCELCERVCPTRALIMDEHKDPEIDYPECILCGKCVEKCPQHSLKIQP